MLHKFSALVAADCLSRVDVSLMSDQVLLELLIAKFDNAENIKDEEGSFTDIKEWYGVGLSDDNRVLCIDWGFDEDLYQEGECDIYPGGYIDLKYLPPILEDFSISCLDLKGTVDTHALPRSLRIFDIEVNSFMGTFDMPGIPPAMERIHLTENEFEGSLDLSNMPRELSSLYANANNFSGSVDLSKIHEPLKILWLQQNEFSGEIDLRKIPSTLEQLLLQNTNISQEVLVIDRFPPRFVNFQFNTDAFGSIQHADGTKVKVESDHITSFVPLHN